MYQKVLYASVSANSPGSPSSPVTASSLGGWVAEPATLTDVFCKWKWGLKSGPGAAVFRSRVLKADTSLNSFFKFIAQT